MSGFTLLEMMVALLVGALSVVVAAKVAQVVIRQSAQGKQSTDFSTRSRLLGRQLRNDLRAAGHGSTGAVAIDRGSPPWNQGGGLGVVINGKAALPVVAGANNLGAMTIGTTPVQPNSDAMMVIVPNPGLSGITAGWSQAGSVRINLDPPPVIPAIPGYQPLANCNSSYIYVVDHTAPNGAGRAQLMNIATLVGSSITTTDSLQFTLAPGSSVMCARLSTYWVDANGWLHRTDFGPNPAPVQIGNGLTYVDRNQVGNDLAAPGVLDLQIAYRFSSEVYNNVGQIIPPASDIWRQWAYEGRAGNLDGLLQGPPADRLENWFEVRRVRFNALLTSVRRVDPRTSGTKTRLGREDGGQSIVDRPLRAEWLTTVESLTNLRYFDHGAPARVRPDPY